MPSTLPKLDPLDRRLNLLDQSGKIIAGDGSPASIAVAFTELREMPDVACAIDTQLMYGELVRVHDIRDGWAWVQAERDQYVGWLEASTLSHDPSPATHIVCVPRTFFYPEPDMKLPLKGMRSLGSEMRVTGDAETRGTRYSILETGEAVITSHIRPISSVDRDFVTIAETLLYTPYLWAGTTAFGLDCSGLIKLAKLMCGEYVLRDSDMQAATIGDEIDPGSRYQNLQRGDLLFWRGHVGICQGRNADGELKLLHANGHSMNVTSEPLLAAVERIAYLYDTPTGVRRAT